MMALARCQDLVSKWYEVGDVFGHQNVLESLRIREHCRIWHSAQSTNVSRTQTAIPIELLRDARIEHLVQKDLQARTSIR